MTAFENKLIEVLEAIEKELTNIRYELNNISEEIKHSQIGRL